MSLAALARNASRGGVEDAVDFISQGIHLDRQ